MNKKRSWLAFSFLLGFCLVALAGHEPGDLDDKITTPVNGYEIYYTNDPNNTADYMSDAQANDAANTMDPFVQRITSLGFRTPYFSYSPGEVHIYSSQNVASAPEGLITVNSPSLSGRDEPSMRTAVDHEHFHHEQYAYINFNDWTSWGRWTVEGTARLMQDKLWNDLDNNAGAITFIGEVGDYMAHPDTRLVDLSYSTCLFWQYLCEQIGKVKTEPEYGVDVIRGFWEQTDGQTPDSMGAVKRMISNLGSSRDFDELFRDFAITNYTKDLDLSAVTNADRYRYIDDDTDAYPDVTIHLSQSFPPTIGPNNAHVNDYAAKYYVGNLTGQAAGMVVGFKSDGDRASYGVMAVRDDKVVSLHYGTGTEYARSFYNSRKNPLDKIAAVVIGLDSGADYTYKFAAGSVKIVIVEPTFTRPAYVGEAANPEKFLVRVQITGPADLGGGTVWGLEASDFDVTVGGVDATVVSGSYVQGEFWMTVQAPVQAGGGPLYSCRVALGEISTTQENAVIYAKIQRDEVIVVDGSGSMLSPEDYPKINAAKAAALMYADTASDDDYAAVVSFGGDNVEPNEDASTKYHLKQVGPNRNAIKTAINNISIAGPGVLTSIGDGLNNAQNELNTSVLPLPMPFIVLLSDGMENEARYWSDVKNTIKNAGTHVISIALGPESDQALMQSIANETGGFYYYVDLNLGSSAKTGSRGTSSAPLAGAGSSAEFAGQLADAYKLSHEMVYGQSRIWEDSGALAAGKSVERTLNVEEGGITNAVFAFFWSNASAGMTVQLVRPNGSTVQNSDAGVDIYSSNNHVVYHINKLDTGKWTVRLTTQNQTDYLAVLSGKPGNGLSMQVRVIPNERTSLVRELDREGIVLFLRGLPIPIQVTLADKGGAIDQAEVIAEVIAPDGGTDIIPLFDDGAHNDQNAGDGIFGGVFRRTTMASQYGESDKSTVPGTNGSYLVKISAKGKDYKKQVFTRIAKAGFQVFEFWSFLQKYQIDQDNDGMPTRFEELYGLDPNKDDSKADLDGEGLFNIDEYLLGTLPNDPDSDHGGESDQSERINERNNNDYRDDQLPRPIDCGVVDFLTDIPSNIPKPNANLLYFPIAKQYTGIQIYRGSNPNNLVLFKELKIDEVKNGIFYDEGLTNGTAYYYQIVGLGQSGARSAPSRILRGIPKADPVPPKGYIKINNGAGRTDSLDVKLDLDTNEDIKEMMIANNAAFTGAAWQPSKGTVNHWIVKPDPTGKYAIVYAKFRDAALNESTVYNDKVTLDFSGDPDHDGFKNSVDPDDDGDGLSDQFELYKSLTNPFVADTNRNGINDDKEDFDQDNLTNLKEQEAGTDPWKADTDGDGFNDDVELKEGTDPLNPNSYPGAKLTPTPTRRIIIRPTTTPTPTPTKRLVFRTPIIRITPIIKFTPIIPKLTPIIPKPSRTWIPIDPDAKEGDPIHLVVTSAREDMTTLQLLVPGVYLSTKNFGGRKFTKLEFPNVVLYGEGFDEGKEWFQFPSDANHQRILPDRYQYALHTGIQKALFPDTLADKQIGAKSGRELEELGLDPAGARPGIPILRGLLAVNPETKSEGLQLVQKGETFDLPLDAPLLPAGYEGTDQTAERIGYTPPELVDEEFYAGFKGEYRGVEADFSWAGRTGGVGAVEMRIPLATFVDAAHLKIAKNLEFEVAHPTNILTSYPCLQLSWDTWVLKPNYINGAELRNELISKDLKIVAKRSARYLILTPQSYREELNDLIAWKESKGLTVDVAIVGNEAGANVAPDRNEIDEYIENYYSKYYCFGVYVLIIGDVDVIPSGRTTRINASPDYSDADSDKVYAVIGDDLFPSVYVGRLSCNSTAELGYQIAKILHYEQSMTLGSWPGIAVLCANSQNDDGSYGVSSSFPSKYAEAVNDIADYGSYTNPPTFEVLHAGADNAATVRAVNQDVIDLINTGRGQVLYRGHGDGNSWTSGWDGSSTYGNSFDQTNELPLLHNSVFPIVYAIACQNSRLRVSDCIAESWMNRDNSGAVAHWGATVNSYTTENHKRALGIFRAIYESGVTRLGPALAEAERYSYDDVGGGSTWESNSFAYLLLGDPEMTIKRRRTLSVAVLNPFLEQLEKGIVLKLIGENDKPVVGALINFELTNGERVNGFTNEDGELILPDVNLSSVLQYGVVSEEYPWAVFKPGFRKTPTPTTTPRVIPTFIGPRLTPILIKTRTPTPTPSPTIGITGKNCVEASDVYTAPASGLSSVNLGYVEFTEATLPDGTPSHLSVTDCSGDGKLDVSIPWSQSTAKQLAAIRFSSNVCQGKAPQAVEIYLEVGTSTTFYAYDDTGALVDTVVMPNIPGVQVVNLSSATGIRVIQIDGAELCILRVCWNCLPYNCIEPWQLTNMTAGSVITANLGLVEIRSAVMPDGSVVQLQVQDCSGDGKLDVLVPWSGATALQKAMIYFSSNICNGKAPELVQVVLRAPNGVTLRAFNDANVYVGTATAAASPAVQTLTLTSSSGIRRIDIVGVEICIIKICWQCDLPERPTPKPTSTRVIEIPTPTRKITISPVKTPIIIQLTPILPRKTPIILPTKRPAVKAYDELVLAQGFGGQSLVSFRNLNPLGTLTAVLRSFFGAPEKFLDVIGGGKGRAAYISSGDLDNDGYEDMVVSLGPITSNTQNPSIVIPRSGKTRNVIGSSFTAFPPGSGAPVNYNVGEVRTAVGDFIGSGMKQIAAAQGFGGNGVVRLFQYTGGTGAGSWKVVGQFDGLSGQAKTTNANGGMTLAAGDLDGDGRDELLVGQTNSPTSQTIFHVLKINQGGAVVNRYPYAGFTPRFRGNGGVELEVADLNGDGVNEIVVASQGNSRDFTPISDLRNTTVLNLITVVIPVIQNGQITGFTRPGGRTVVNVFNENVNPSGAISIAAGEFNGSNADGEELVIGTGSLLKIDGFNITPIKPAPQSKYTVQKLMFDGANITDLVRLIGPASGLNAFVGPYNPSSGAVFVGSVNPGQEVPPTPVPTPSPLPILYADPIWVDVHNDSGIENGTEQHPFNTIAEAMVVAATHTIRVRSGVYHENVIMKNGVKLIADGSSNTILDAEGVGFGVQCIGVSSSSLLSGFTITNAAVGIYLNNSALAIRDNNITNIDYASLGADGIRLDDSSPLIQNNLIYHVGGMGIRAQGNSEPKIINNTIYDYGYYAGISFAALNIGAVSPVIKNNIVARGNSQPVGGILWKLPATPILSYNDVYDPANVAPTSGGSYFAYHDGTQWQEGSGGVGSITEDPKFIDPAHGYFYLNPSSPCIDAGDPDPGYNDNDGSRNDMGAYGGHRLNIGPAAHIGSGFIFTSVGKIPVTEIVQNAADPSFGLAKVSDVAAADYHIPKYTDSPFGEYLWIRGLFGVGDDVDYYQIIATPLSGGDAFAINDPLTKTLYTINPDGTVSSTNILLGPQTVAGVPSLYQLNKEGYWSQQDLRIIWNTTGLNGKYRLNYKAYRLLDDGSLEEIVLPANDLDHMTLWLDNTPLSVVINQVLYADHTNLVECENITFPHNGSSELIFNITANHPSGFLRYLVLDCYWGHNNFGGRFTYDNYVGSHDVPPPLWAGPLNVELPPLLPKNYDGSVMSWVDCAYRFRLEAGTRTTNGDYYLQYGTTSVYHSVDNTAIGFDAPTAIEPACLTESAEPNSPAVADLKPLSQIPPPAKVTEKLSLKAKKTSGKPVVAPLAAGDVASDFVDLWENNDPNTGGMTKVLIGLGAGGLTIHGYGKCHPTDCDWGTIEVPFTGNPFTAVYEFGFKTTTLTVHLVDSLNLQIHSNNVFHDGSGRDYEADYSFHRAGFGGHVIWVDDDNISGTEDGSLPHPYNTIAEGIAAAVSGDTVRVLAGNYAENVVLKDGVNLIGSGADTTFINPGGTGWGVEAVGIGADTLLFGFTITNAELGIYLHSSNLSIRENIIADMDLSSLSADGIRLDNSSPVIRNNVIYRVGGVGIRAQGNSAPQIINNTIYDYRYYAGISFASLNIGAVSPVIENNIIVRGNTEPVGGILWNQPANPVLSYNDVLDPANVTGTGSFYSYHDGTSWHEGSGGVGAISSDPLFVDEEHGYFRLMPLSPCIDAGDPLPMFNDNDGSRNDMGAFGGHRFNLTETSHAGSGFVFTSIGNVPITEIVADPGNPSYGLLQVSDEVAESLHIPKYTDSPFGGYLWIRGLFGADDAVDYYQILATPEGSAEPIVLSDPLVKTKFTINPDGTVTNTRVQMGPLNVGGVSNLYLLNKAGYWSFTDLRYIWNTTGLNGKYTITYKAFQSQPDGSVTEVALPANSLDHFTLILNNQSVQVKINSIAYTDHTPLAECEKIMLPHNGDNSLIFNITAYHPGGYLMYYLLNCYWGNNRYGGQFTYDQYVGSHDSPPPAWSGVYNYELPPLLPRDSGGAVMPWHNCAYGFYLTAYTRITDGVQYLVWKQDAVFQSVVPAP